MGGKYNSFEPEHTRRFVEFSWFWTFLLGIGMFFGGVLAFIIAVSRVILPYDEDMVGLTRAQLIEANEQLLPFMAHDRVSLAGTMISLGVLYAGLSWFAARRGHSWARTSVLVSAYAGFFSFFMFLGFGYFDPFHAFVTAVLFQILLMATYARSIQRTASPITGALFQGPPRFQLGRMILIGHALGLLGSGLVISTIGMTDVFVHTDLDFMKTTIEELESVSPRLIPLVAHDRATMGGMLIANGISFLWISLFGLDLGARWLWWTMVAAGLPAYACAIGVHFAVGYTHLEHLAPAMLGLSALVAGLATIWAAEAKQ